MAELRWILLGLGLLLVTGVYFWGRGLFRRRQDARIDRRPRLEPRLSADPQFADERTEPRWSALPQGPRVTDVHATRASSSHAATPRVSPEPVEPDLIVAAPEAEAPTHRSAAARAPEKIVTIRFVPKSDELDSPTAVLALREAGLRHGRYGIFHFTADDDTDDAQFSVASLTEPGSFDLENLADKPIPGMSFFMVLPGNGDPVSRFDRMVSTARALALRLDAELYDERGSSWSIQRERYVREEIIRYRHQLG